MKRSTLSILAASAAFFTGAQLFGADKPKTPAPAPAPAASAPQQKLFKIATLPTAKDNTEFQANVQFMQTQRQKLVELGTAVEKEKDAKKKAELKKSFDEATAKLTADNEQMIKMYGFSLSRNYIIEVERSNIYLVLTDDEAAKIEKEEKAKAAAKK